MLVRQMLVLGYADKTTRVITVCSGYVESDMVNKEELGDFYVD